jgi:hypothetical protein
VELRHVSAGRHPRRIRDLHERQLAHQLWMVRQHALKRLQLELDTLEHVQVVHTQQNRPAFQLREQLAAPPPKLGPLPPRKQPLRIHPSRHDLHAYLPSIIVDADRTTRRLVRQAQHARAARQEVARIVERVETDQVGIQQRAQQLLPTRKRAEQLRRGKGGVQEKAEAHFVKALAEERGQDEQVVVVHPNKVVVGDGLVDDGFAKRLVCLYVRLPQGWIEPARG